MKHKLAALILCLLATAPVADRAFAEQKEDFKAAIDFSLRERCVSHDKTAVRITDVATGETLYDLNGSSPLLPASVMKLVTTATALNYLGVNYKFKTDVLYSGKRERGVIKGDLIIRGGGDPKLTPEVVWLIADEVRRQGIREVTGNLVLDTSFFDDHTIPPARHGRRTQRPYDAPIGALSVNFNTIAVHVYPGEAVGAPVIAEVEPRSDYFRVINDAVTRSRVKRPVSALRVNGDGKVNIKITGAMRPDDAPGIIYINIDDPTMFAGETFRAFLKNAGVNVAGGIVKGVTPTTARLIHAHQSEPISVILRELNRFSNNFIAEQVIKTVGAETMGAPGTHEKGLSMVEKFLNESGIDTTGAVFADGSGLSKENRVSAKMLTDLLLLMSKRFDIGPDFVASPGIMGVDGSVRKRLKTSPAKSQARAKTGTLNGVSSLSGYVSGRDGKLFAFAILQNNNACYYKGAHNIQDKIVTAIHLLAEKKR